MKVLVPVEDRNFGQRIVDYIKDRSWPDDTEFCLFHAIDPARLNHFSDISFGEFLKDVAAQEITEAKELVDGLSTQLKMNLKNHEIGTKTVEGYPKDEILREAEEWPADLIIIGSHGRNPVQRFLLGSVSMAVIGAAPCSVLLVKDPNRVAAGQHPTEHEKGKMHVII